VDAADRAHLFKHSFQRPDGKVIRLQLEDVLDLYVWNSVVYYPADLSKGPAHWLMVGEVEGIVISVALMPALSGDPSKCRPISLSPASAAIRDQFRRDAR
jgi:hypothetical protein